MTLKILLLSVICHGIICYPQSIKLPLLKTAPPFDINSLERHNHQPRSVPTDVNSQNNLEETIEEVEALLKANPTLPRLTRGEIMDLLDNITKTDAAKSKVMNKNEVKGRDPKAIMVVMPYTAPNGNENGMEELYTKPPVTHIIGSEPFTNTRTVQTVGPTAVTPPSTTKRTSHRRRRPTPPPGNTPIGTPTLTTYHPTRRPSRRRTTTTERYPNHKYPDEVSTESEPVQLATGLPSNGIRIIEAPKFTISDISEDLQMQENRQDAFVGKAPNEKTPVYVDATQTSTASTLTDTVPGNLKGVVSDINSHTPSSATKSSDSEEDDRIRNLLASFGVLPVKTTSTTTPVPDISNLADNLTPEMRDLLKSFGLIPESNDKASSVSATAASTFEFNPVKAEVKPEAYVGFKPLPDDDTSRRDMEELLARFGLGRNARKEKALPKKNEENSLSFEAVPEEYMSVLENIGLTDSTDRKGKMISSAPLAKVHEKQHVFNPDEVQYASDDELARLNKLLDVVKELEKLNGTATEDDLKKIDVESLKELISSFNQDGKVLPLDEQNAPNPLNFDYGLEKNEVKRQENSSTTTAAPTTQEPANGNIKDLEASFGGQVDATTTTEVPVEETTPLRKTGFYYLMDWNTFLDIDDQKGKRVNLRFQPKVGDPKRFYSVSVP